MKTKKHDAIIWSLTAFSLVIIITLLFTSAVEKIINYTIFLDSIGMSTTAACLFVLRRRKIGEERGDIYRMRLYPILPLIFIFAYISVATSIVLDDPLTAGYGAMILALFFVLYFVIHRAKK